MLNHHSLLLETAYLQQQEMFRQAEAERLYRQLKETRPGLLQRSSTYWLVAVRCLEVYLQPNSATPILSEK
ncbi:MAG: hypothetical protein KJ077_22985 [Anaerolineae bacterium]|nr:hypothetical protein [Anaerolineae bacterium]